ncbi:cupin domain-containing protein [Leisingera caerulea]|uniref:cupin domain-containing protein n=1 Tax=Leisingera caerulea TaxID=506591 RepID=UPI0003FF1286|nr:cupin domain-containing protein [Leisingera caerulea]
MPKLDLSQLPWRTGSDYPGKLAEACKGRSVQPLGDPGGLSQFGVNIVRLEPGAASSLRHYHMEQDEFVIVTEGSCTLIDDQGAHEMQPGDCAAFPAGEANGHHLVNRSDKPAAFLVVGTRTETETGYYSDLDMMVKLAEGQFTFTRKDGSPLTADQTGENS